MKADIVTMGLENLKIGADVEAVFVDEAHFFTGVKAFACECAMRGIEVFFAGLYGRGTPAHSFFAEMAGLLVVADNVRFLKADCAECKAANTAIFSRFITTDPRIHQMVSKAFQHLQGRIDLIVCRWSRENTTLSWLVELRSIARSVGSVFRRATKTTFLQVPSLPQQSNFSLTLLLCLPLDIIWNRSG